MDANVGPELLAPQADRGEEQDQRVERVPAHPRLRRGMGLAAVERHVDVLARQEPALDIGHVGRVVEERRIEAPEQAVADHDPLPRPALLRRGPEEHDLTGDLRRDRRQGDRRAHPGCRHRVVPTAMPESGQRVVFGQDPDSWPGAGLAAPEDPPDGGRQAAGGMVDGVAMPGDGLGDPGRGLALLEGGLGVGMDPMGQLEDLGPVGLDGRCDPTLAGGERLGGLAGEEGEGLDGQRMLLRCSASFSARRTGWLRRRRR